MPLNRRDFFKGLSVGLAATAMPKTVRAMAIAPKAERELYAVGGVTIFPVYRHDEPWLNRETGITGLHRIEEKAIRNFDYTLSRHRLSAITALPEGEIDRLVARMQKEVLHAA